MALKGIRRLLGARASTIEAPRDEAPALSTEPLEPGSGPSAAIDAEAVDPLVAAAQRSVDFGTSAPDQLARLAPDPEPSTDGETGSPGQESPGEMSAEGAEGTMTTLDAGGSTPGDDAQRSDPADSYEPPSAWDHIVQSFSPDLDADGDGTMDVAQDSDGDGLSDYDERWRYGTNPYKADTDGDGLSDSAEVAGPTDPTKADTDGDILTDSFEQEANTDPTKADTDGDGLLDSYEDADDDGVANLLEQLQGTDPQNADSDNDGTTDGGEPVGDLLDRLTIESRRATAERKAAAREVREVGESEPDGPRVITDPEAAKGADYLATKGLGAMVDPKAPLIDKATGEGVYLEDVEPGKTIDMSGQWGRAQVEGRTNLQLSDEAREKLGLDEDAVYDSEADSGKDDPAETGHAGSSELEKVGFYEGEGEGEDPFLLDEDGDGVPDAIDPDTMTVEPDTPDVPGSRTDPNASLFGESRIDPAGGGSAVGTDPWGPGTSPAAGDDQNPVGKSVDPNDFAGPSSRVGGATGTGAAPPGTAADPFGSSRVGQTDPLAGMESSATNPFGTDVPGGGSGSGTGSSADGGDADGDSGWISGRVEGLDGEMTVTPDSDGQSGSADGDLVVYTQDENGNWIGSDGSTSSSDPLAGDTAEGGSNDDSGGGDSGNDGGESGGGESGSPSFGGGMDVDRPALLDALGRSSRAGSAGTEMKAPTTPFENNSVTERPPPNPTAPSTGSTMRNEPGSLDPNADTDGDGVPDASEEMAGTDPDDKSDFLDSDSDGVPDYVEEGQGSDPHDDSDFVDDDGDGRPDYAQEPGEDEASGSDEDQATSAGSDDADDEPPDHEGVGTSGNALDPGFATRVDAIEATEAVGAPQNGAQPQPIDPSPWEGAVEQGTMVGEIITSDDLAQPVPDQGQGGEHLRENSGVDPNASSGMFGTGAIDPGPGDDTVQTEGPWQDTPPIPDLDAAHDDSESPDGSTPDPELVEAELGIALEATPVEESEPMSLIATPSGMSAPLAADDPSDGVDAEPAPVTIASIVDDPEWVDGIGLGATRLPSEVEVDVGDGAVSDSNGSGEESAFVSRFDAFVEPTQSEGFGASAVPSVDDFVTVDDTADIDPAKALALGLTPEAESPIDLGDPVMKTEAADVGVDGGHAADEQIDLSVEDL